MDYRREQVSRCLEEMSEDKENWRAYLFELWDLAYRAGRDVGFHEGVADGYEDGYREAKQGYSPG